MLYRKLFSLFMRLAILAGLLSACAAPGDQVPDLRGTSWQLSALNGQVLPEGVDITLEFAAGQVSGKAACNSYFAEYRQQGSELSFSAVGGTEMYCEGLMQYESDYYAALNQVKRLALKDGVLSLLDGNGTAILTYGAPQPAPSLAGTSWSVISVGELQVAEGMDVSMAFADGQVSGKAGCNSYFAGYTQDGSSLRFEQAGATRMYCDEAALMAVESAFLASLDKVRSLQADPGRMLLLDENGAALIVLSQ